ncbi:MAG: hypothetical protein WA902_11935, partial [Thermosynechococcaceae cyanobacterium]
LVVRSAVYGACNPVPFDKQISFLLLFTHLSLTLGILAKGFFLIFRNPKTPSEGQLSAFLALMSLFSLLFLTALNFTGMACK